MDKSTMPIKPQLLDDIAPVLLKYLKDKKLPKNKRRRKGNRHR